MHAANETGKLSCWQLAAPGSAFVGVVPDDQRNIVLLALGKNRGNVLRQTPSHQQRF